MKDLWACFCEKGPLLVLVTEIETFIITALGPYRDLVFRTRTLALPNSIHQANSKTILTPILKKENNSMSWFSLCPFSNKSCFGIAELRLLKIVKAY